MLWLETEGLDICRCPVLLREEHDLVKQYDIPVFILRRGLGSPKDPVLPP